MSKAGKDSEYTPFVIVMMILGAAVGGIVAGPLIWVLFSAFWDGGLPWWAWSLIAGFLGLAVAGSNAQEHEKKERLKKAQLRFYERWGEEPPDSGNE